MNGEASGVLEVNSAWIGGAGVPNVVLQRAKVLSPFHPGLWFVSGGGSAALEEARYGRWAAAEGGGGGRGRQRHSESKTWPFQLALLHRVLEVDRRCKLQNPNCASVLRAV